MRKFWFIPFILMILQACGSGSNQFTIEGKLENAKNEKIYLIELTSDGINAVDSVNLDQDGRFKFTGYTEVAKFFLVRTSPRNSVTLIVEPGDNIAMKGDARNFGVNYSVSGSEGSMEILNLRRNLEATVHRLDSLGMVYRDNPDEEDMDVLRNRLNDESREIVEDQKQYTKNFIERNLSSLASLMALYQQIGPRNYVLDPLTEFEYFKKVDSSLMANYPNSEPVKSLHSQIQEIERRMNIDKASMERLALGKEAPEISLPDPKGDTINLSSLQGNYVLVDFWASWCKPCRIENPNLVKTYKMFQDRDFEIYQVSLDRDRTAWINAIEQDQLEWYHVSDLRFWNSQAAQTYNVRSIPANFLLNRSGEIISKDLRGDQLRAELEKIFSKE